MCIYHMNNANYNDMFMIGETIIAAHGDVYEMTFTDWYKSFYTLGLYYYCTIAGIIRYIYTYIYYYVYTERIVMQNLY